MHYMQTDRQADRQQCTNIFSLMYFQLYNVVVDTEVTGKKLISNGKLKRRYTFIPLNKIASRTLSNDVVKRAESLVS